MAVNISRLLKKGKLTGREVGQALLANSVESYKRTLQGFADGSIDKDNPNSEAPQGTFTTADLQTMINKLTESWDIKQYNKYVHINNYVTSEMGYAAAYMQQAQAGFMKLMNFIGGVMRAEQNISVVMHTPCIMTKKQYDYYYNLAMKDYRDTELCFFDIYRSIANNYIADYLENPAADDNPLAAVLRKYEKQSFKGKSFMSRYRKTYYDFFGHYETADGISQANVSDEEWEKIVSDYAVKFRNERQNKEDYYDRASSSGYDLAFDISNIKDGRKPIETESPLYEYFHWVDDDITELQGKDHLWTIINCYEIFDYVDTLKMAKKEYEDFQKDFPELHEAIMKVFKDILPDGAALPIEDFDKVIITWGELMDRKLLPREIITPSDMAISQFVDDQEMRARINNAGIAVLREDDACVNMYDVDEQGFYVEPQGSKDITYSGSIDSIMNNDTVIEELENTVEMQIEDALREVYAYREVNALISQLTDVDVSVFMFSSDIESLEDKIDAYNALCLNIRRRIRYNTCMVGKDEAEERYKAFCDIFPLIDVKNYMPTEENIENTRNYITNTDDAFAAHTPRIGLTMKRKGDMVEYDNYEDDEEE